MKNFIKFLVLLVGLVFSVNAASFDDAHNGFIDELEEDNKKTKIKSRASHGSIGRSQDFYYDSRDVRNFYRYNNRDDSSFASPTINGNANIYVDARRKIKVRNKRRKKIYIASPKIENSRGNKIDLTIKATTIEINAASGKEVFIASPRLNKVHNSSIKTKLTATYIKVD